MTAPNFKCKRISNAFNIERTFRGDTSMYKKNASGWIKSLSMQMEVLRIKKMIDNCMKKGLIIHFNLAKISEHAGVKQSVERIGDYTIRTTSFNFMSPRQVFMKRMLEIAAGIVGCITTEIIFLFIVPIIYISSPRGAYFLCTRTCRSKRKNI